MIKTAVILAAGMGTRIRKLLKNVPKGFLDIGGETLIEQSIKKLKTCGIERIIIVTGYLSEYYESLVKTYDLVETVKNNVYAESGSMYSFWCAKDLIEDDMLLLESDLIYESRAIEELIKNDKEDVILLSGRTNSGDEVFIETRDGKIKNLSKDKNDLKEITGELVGISRISYKLYQKMLKEAENMFETTLKIDYEDCIGRTANIHPIYFLKIEDLIWAEIDDENHLKRAREEIFPRLTK